MSCSASFFYPLSQHKIAQTSKFWNDHFRGKLHDASITWKNRSVLNVDPQPPALMFRMPRSCKEGVPESVNVFWLKFNQLGSGCPETTPSSRMGMDWGQQNWSGNCQEPFRFNTDMLQPRFSHWFNDVQCVGLIQNHLGQVQETQTHTLQSIDTMLKTFWCSKWYTTGKKG